MTFVACFAIGLDAFAIDGFCEDPGAGGFTNASRSAKQEGVCKLFIFDGVLKSGGDMALAHYGVESLRPVFPGRNNEFLHSGEGSKIVIHHLIIRNT